MDPADSPRINGKSTRPAGSASMDMMVVHLSDIQGAAVGDIVTIIGRDGKEEITACEVASRARVSHYELLTRINPLIQKFDFP